MIEEISCMGRKHYIGVSNKGQLMFFNHSKAQLMALKVEAALLSKQKVGCLHAAQSLFNLANDYRVEYPEEKSSEGSDLGVRMSLPYSLRSWAKSVTGPCSLVSNGDIARLTLARLLSSKTIAERSLSKFSEALDTFLADNTANLNSHQLKVSIGKSPKVVLSALHGGLILIPYNWILTVYKAGLSNIGNILVLQLGKKLKKNAIRTDYVNSVIWSPSISGEAYATITDARPHYQEPIVTDIYMSAPHLASI